MTWDGDPVGRTLGHYRIVERIGAGGMGVVFRAHDDRLDRDVAIKVLPPGTLADEPARRRFHKEAQALSQLNHPNVATVHDFDTQEGVDFLVMEEVPGSSLDHRLESGSPLPEKEVARYGMQLAEGLAAAHEKGVVHRDLKPGNLQVTPDGRLKILDFGLARWRQAVGPADVTRSVSEAQHVVGTLPYMAPEQVQGEPADARTDIYGAGAVCYEMATGRPPFPEAQGPRLVDAILHQVPVTPRALNPRVLPDLERIILKCLEKDAEDRYQSAKELLVDLRRLALPSAASTTAVPAPRRPGLPRTVLVPAVVALVALIAVGTWYWYAAHRKSAVLVTPQITSLAVLPLANLSGDASQEYFADGMTEELIATLSKISALKVISRTSVIRFKGSKKPLREIAAALGAEGVIEGSVLRAGERVRITVQLINATTDTHLWAESYDRDLKDVLALQSDVARAVAGEVRATLTPQEQTRLTRTRPVNPDVYEAYLQGRFYWNKRTGQSLATAIQYFQRTVEIDPEYALAYAGLADSFQLLPDYGGVRPRDAFPKAMAAAEKAVAIDETLAEGHYSLAYIKALYDLGWVGAEQEFKRAIELDPRSATAHHWYGWFLIRLGRFDEARSELEQARALDPLSLPINTSLGTLLLYTRRYDEAIAQYRKVLEMDPDFAQAHDYLGNAYVLNGMPDRAIAEFQKTEAVSGSMIRSVAGLGRAYAAAGKRDQARKVLARLTAESRRGYVSWFELALLHTALGDKEQAFSCLDRSYEERDARLSELRVAPQVDPLRADPRFHALLRKMNFPR